MAHWIPPSRGPLNPQASPGWRFEGIREILCLVYNLTVAELHNTHRVGWPILVGDGIFPGPEVGCSENSPDVKTGRLAWMMTPQGLQILSPKDSLAWLRIVTNGILIVNIVFCVCIAGCRRLPVFIQSFSYLFFLHDHLPPGMKPGLPVFSTLLNQEFVSTPTRSITVAPQFRSAY
jgi:hypothetical protein